jgi:hypothetical protein
MGRSPGGNHAAEVGRQLLKLDWRKDDLVGAGAFGQLGIKLAAGFGNDQDRDVGALGSGSPIGAAAQSAQELECPNTAERRIQHHYIERPKSEDFERLDRAGDGACPESGIDEPFAEECRQLGVVANDKYVRALQGW